METADIINLIVINDGREKRRRRTSADSSSSGGGHVSWQKPLYHANRSQCAATQYQHVIRVPFGPYLLFDSHNISEKVVLLPRSWIQ